MTRSHCPTCGSVYWFNRYGVKGKKQRRWGIFWRTPYTICRDAWHDWGMM